MQPDERIFVYLRLRAGGEILAKSKVRELKALGKMLADFAAESVIGASPRPDVSPSEIAFEYVDASNEQPLVCFRADVAARELVVNGCIPRAYRKRMLDSGPDGPTISRAAFEERARQRVGEAAAHELAERAFEKQIDLLGLIEKAIDAEGSFSVRVPMPQEE